MSEELRDLPGLESSGPPNLAVSNYKPGEKLNLYGENRRGLLLTAEEWKKLKSSGGGGMTKRPRNSRGNKDPYEVFIPYGENGGETIVRAALDQAQLVNEGEETIVF